MDIDKLDSSQYFKGSIEDLIDRDEQLSSQKTANAFRSVLQLVALELVEIELPHDLAYDILTL